MIALPAIALSQPQKFRLALFTLPSLVTYKYRTSIESTSVKSIFVTWPARVNYSTEFTSVDLIWVTWPARVNYYYPTWFLSWDNCLQCALISRPLLVLLLLLSLHPSSLTIQSMTGPCHCAIESITSCGQINLGSTATHYPTQFCKVNDHSPIKD